MGLYLRHKPKTIFFTLKKIIPIEDLKSDFVEKSLFNFYMNFLFVYFAINSISRMTKYAIIVAGGKGTRFGSDMPKQFLPLKGIPVLMHTIAKFKSCKTQIIVVLPESQISIWKELCVTHIFNIPHTIIAGGHTRFHSVKNALDSISPSEDDLIAVHDGVRPLVSTSIINEAYDTASIHNSAIPATDVTDTIRQFNNDGTASATLNRASLKAVQTPQTFKAELLKRAYSLPYTDTFTDDASVVEATGHQVTLTKGDPKNIKITHAIDLIIAEELIENE